MSTRAVAAIRPVPLSSQARVPSDPVRQRRLYAYQPLEACDDLKCDPSGRSFLRNRVGRRGLTPIGKGTNQIHGDTVIVAETGKKMPV